MHVLQPGAGTRSAGAALDAVVEATRSLLWVQTGADARRTTEDLVRRLGGKVVSAHDHDDDVLPADISFGDGEPSVASAPIGSEARANLDLHLGPFLLDARRALQLSGRLERLDEEASTDRLTSLPNRRAMDRALGRLGADAAVIMLDLDHFKKVNDELGHQMGDKVLLAFGNALHSVVRSNEVAGRFGGEEFLAIVPSADEADSLLERLRARWLATRPIPISFSAGIARSVGEPIATLRSADVALYRAKEAGRDQWVWSQPDDLPPAEPAVPAPCQFVDRYVEEAVRGERRSAIRTALDMFDRGASQHLVIEDLLAASQRQVGERWHRNQLTVADEHIATGVSAAALDAVVSEGGPVDGDGHTIVVCAEGDWHSLAAQMFGESLRSFGVGVTVLGASIPTRHVVEMLSRLEADSLAVSCSLPIHFPGVIRLVEAAHAIGVPVIVGGRAFGASGDERAERLGADAWAANADQAALVLRGWRLGGAPALRPSVSPGHGALHMMERATAIAQAVLTRLGSGLPTLAADGGDRPTPSLEDIVFDVQFLAASALVRDDGIFTDFLDWLHSLLTSRGASPTALSATLAAVRAVIGQEYPDSVRLLDLGEQRLAALGESVASARQRVR